MDFFRKTLIGCFFGLILTIQAQAAAPGECISKADMNEIAAKFTQFQNLAGKEYCYDGSDISRLLEGIMFMRNTKFAASMPVSKDDMFSGKFAKDWWGYFTGRINKFSVKKSCPKGAGAFVQPVFGGKTMFVCPLMLSDAFSSMDSASVYMHEARHIDGFPHTTCTHGPRAGLQGACDDDIKTGGSYAVTVETYAQIAKYADTVHPAMKAFAKASALIYAAEAFEAPVSIDFTQDFVILTKSLQFHQITSGGPLKFKSLGMATDLGSIMIRREFFVMFPDDKNLPAKFIFTKDEGDLNQVPGADAAEYNAQTPAERAKLVGIHYGGSWGAKVTLDKARFVCDPYGSATKTEIALTGGTPVSIIYPNGYDKQSMKSHIQMDSGTVLEIGCKDKNTPYVQNSNLKFDKVYKKIYKSSGTVLGLTFDGHLFDLTNGKVTPVQSAYDGQIHDLLGNTTYTFFDI